VCISDSIFLDRSQSGVQLWGQNFLSSYIVDATQCQRVPVAAQMKALKVFGSSPAFFCVMPSSVGRGLATDRCPFQGALPKCLKMTS
jgi:hypothetical protein